jgi:hypothetical protein
MNCELLKTALGFAKRGIPVFPVHGIKQKDSKNICTCWAEDECNQPGKHPQLKDGLYAASTDAGLIKWWFEKFPEMNLGIITGSQSGFFVLDVDGDEGHESLAALERQHSALPETTEVITGGGGSHYYFKCPAGMKIKNSVSEVAPKLDIRGDGGYVLAPGSLHKSGRRYEWSVDTEDERPGIADAPDWLLKLMASKPASSGQPYQKKDWSHLKQPIPEGTRNNQLIRIAGHLCGKRVDGNILIPAMIGLNEALCQPPLELDELMQIINSAAGMAMKNNDMKGF